MLVPLGCVYQKAHTVPKLLFTHLGRVAQLSSAPSVLGRRVTGPSSRVLNAMETKRTGTIAMPQ